ncbi:DUF1996 domain-containing protein [Cryptosporangium japonicum]|uniref:DUF1996 domain-containing protein n=1 Tax=Cryptosporangium japonicum TaxID=80872 RepID=UPI0031D3759E
MSERRLIGLVAGIVVLAMLVGGAIGLSLARRPAHTPGTPESHAPRPAPNYVPIEDVVPGQRRETPRGTYVAHCGDNEEGHWNSDNFIVSPGIRNGAHHLHDYVGNTDSSAASTDESLAAAGTTCADRGDTSAYFWPVLRDRTDVAGQQRVPGEDPADGNVGRVLRPRVTLRFEGNPYAPVVAPPRLLRVLTGDAKAVTAGARNARATYTCAGFEDRITTVAYPLCPLGRGLTRILEFPSCWDGRNTDSAGHRAHMRFPDRAGRCPAATRPVPKLTMTLVYDVPAGPSFAIDTFGDQGHAPITDHADFVNLRTAASTALLLRCLNAKPRAAGTASPSTPTAPPGTPGRPAPSTTPPAGCG